VSLKKVLVLY